MWLNLRHCFSCTLYETAIPHILVVLIGHVDPGWRHVCTVDGKWLMLQPWAHAWVPSREHSWIRMPKCMEHVHVVYPLCSLLDFRVRQEDELRSCSGLYLNQSIYKHWSPSIFVAQSLPVLLRRPNGLFSFPTCLRVTFLVFSQRAGLWCCCVQTLELS